MCEQLTYAQPARRHRRTAVVVAVLTIPVLAASYHFALPKYRTFSDHQARRTAVRNQFETELATARQAVREDDPNAAAYALFNAEFPTRTERHLFPQSEADGFDRQLANVRSDVQSLFAKRRVKEEQERLAAEAKRKREEEYRRSLDGLVVETHCTLIDESGGRRGTLDDLHDRAIHMLRLGKNTNAFDICQQIIVIDPAHEFPERFWANVQPKP